MERLLVETGALSVGPGSFLSLVKGLKLVVFDFDGVFTTNEVLVQEDGVESVICNRSDGLAIKILRELRLEPLILSTEKNPVVRARARKLDIECLHGFDDKATELQRVLREKGLSGSQAAYVGNDINDLGCFSLVGLPVAVGDAFPEVKAAALWVLKAFGGRGAVREFCHTVGKVRGSSLLTAAGIAPARSFEGGT